MSETREIQGVICSGSMGVGIKLSVWEEQVHPRPPSLRLLLRIRCESDIHSKARKKGSCVSEHLVNPNRATGS